MQDKRTEILKILQSKFEGCEIRINSSIVEIKRNRIVLNFGRPIIVDELLYYYDNNILEQELTQLKEF